MLASLRTAVAALLISANAFAQVASIEAPGLHNVFRLTTNIFSGSTPETDEAFAKLRELGVKTIISVDGALPNVEAAARAGLRYVHLPNGYDGISTNAQARLAKAAVTLPTPVYVHCHHGAHRGPAAAAILCMTRDNWSAGESIAWLHRAGTSSNYAGLFASVEAFKPLSREALNRVPNDFPARAEVPETAAAMVEIDRHFENLKVALKSPEAHPDIVPSNVALILREQFRELGRKNKNEAAWTEAETLAAELENALRSDIKSSAYKANVDRAFLRLKDNCASCHRETRDK